MDPVFMIENRVNHMNFRVLLERDEDGFFTITVPSLPGCISQGDTEAEAKENIERSRRDIASLEAELEHSQEQLDGL